TVLTEEGWVKRKLEKPPVPKADTSAISYEVQLSEVVNLYKKGRSLDESGFLEISFIVDENGVESDHMIETPLVPDLDAEFLRARKLLVRKWEPGILNGKPVKTKVIYTARFNINRLN